MRYRRTYVLKNASREVILYICIWQISSKCTLKSKALLQFGTLQWSDMEQNGCDAVFVFFVPIWIPFLVGSFSYRQLIGHKK